MSYLERFDKRFLAAWIYIAWIFFFPPSLNAQPTQSRCGQTVSVTGVVQIGAKKLQPGDSIFPGEEIRTDDKSVGKFLMVDQSVLDVGPNSVLSVKEYAVSQSGNRNVDMSLDLGDIRAVVSKKLKQPGKFFIRTKGSVLAVRGTELIAGWSRKGNQFTEQVTVLEGNVLRSSPNGSAPPVQITPGTQFKNLGMIVGNKVIPQTASGAIVKLNGNELNRVAESHRVVDTTFMQSVSLNATASSSPSTASDQTFHSITSNVGNEPNRKPASTVDITAIPSAIGQDSSNGSSAIPGFSGVPGTTITSPFSPPPPSRLPVNVTVVFTP